MIATTSVRVSAGLRISPTQSSRFGLPIGLILTFIITLVVWLPALRNDFVDWDDLNMIVHNPRFNPPTWVGTGWYWVHPAWNLYQPMCATLWASLARFSWVDAPDQFGGHLNPQVFHLAGIVLHTLTTALLFSVLWRLFRRQLPAAIGALLFGLHPIQTEAVVFAGALNNPLACFFSLLSICLFLPIVDPAQVATRPLQNMRWALALAALLLATLSKPSAVVVPPICFVLIVAFFRFSVLQALRAVAAAGLSHLAVRDLDEADPARCIHRRPADA